ncbi:MAG: GNAT family N-acetyltransferase [Proteiniphilum sp.]|nr:GNAT family N-acetyltransferase [Proteiniphilum sp.]
MIRFADDTTKQEVWDMWKICFSDPDDYMEIYFRHKYRNENTLLYVDEGKAVASLQMLPYQFTFCGAEIPVIYLSGVCTLPEARKKGFMHQLLLNSFGEAVRRGIPLMLLVPQEEWLLQFYDKYGFAQTFDAGTEPLPSLRELTDAHPGDLHAAYRAFNTMYRQNDMTLQKTFDDFLAMIEEAKLYDYPLKKNLRGMARVIDAERLLSFFADRYEEKIFSVVLQDELLHDNNDQFSLSGGIAGRTILPEEPCFSLDIRELTQLLFGYHTSAKEEPLRSIFPEKMPQMHFMLE